jgi:hypothetical protein
MVVSSGQASPRFCATNEVRQAPPLQEIESSSSSGGNPIPTRRGALFPRHFLSGQEIEQFAANIVTSLPGGFAA